MEHNGNPFLQIQTELQPAFPTLAQAADTILDAEVSAYPIFIAARVEAPIGVLLAHLQPTGWYLYASTLEELVARQVVLTQHLAQFRAVYKNPRQHFCIFAIQEQGSNFLFVPRPGEKTATSDSD